MIELTRFQQLRQVQKLAEEDKQHVGLSLYPDGKLSDLAKALKEAATTEAHTALVGRQLKREGEISDLQAVNPVIRALYAWLDFKSRPIKLEDFKEALKTLNPKDDLDLEKEWARYADELLLAIERGLLQKNSCVDYQLLLRICHLIRRCLARNEKGKFSLLEDVTSELINQILTRPILLPPRILRDRCADNCKERSRMALPQVRHEEASNSRTPCDCKCDDSCQPPSHSCLCIKPYVADLFTIKEELARFEAGDIADIENILAGEHKSRKHRTLLHSETSTETETETVTSEERDHQVTEKFTLQSEVKNTVDQKVNVDAGITATLKYGDSVTITPHANVTANFSKSESQSVARSYAKDLVDRSVSKVQEKARRVQISKVINEVEERNHHSIDNTLAGAAHRAGIYYWVNKVTHAQVFNHGRHMMFDLIVPEPAATFKKLFQLKLDKDHAAQAPTKPNITPQSIQRNTYGTYLTQYAIATTEVIAPPEPTACVQFAFSHNVTEPTDSTTAAFSSNEFKSPEIPKGYKAATAHFDIRCSTGHAVGTEHYDEVAVSVNLGDLCLLSASLSEFADERSGIPLPHKNENWVAMPNTLPMKGEEGSLTLAVAGFSSLALSISGSVSITCTLTSEEFEKWQTRICQLIMTDYNRKLDAYNAAQHQDDQLFQIKGRNPFLNREIERNEFKRHIVAILMCNYFNGMGSMMEKVMPCGYPEINFDRLATDAPVIQFFEQIFEWEYLTYLFYHSMWARKCKWPDLIDEDSGDPLFDKFLMSGAARVQVPIRPGMEHLFGWFLKTGQLWGATGVPPVSGDDEYVAMIQELKEARQGDYSDRPGEIEATKGSNVLVLTDSTWYWDLVNNKPDALNLANDKDREILVNYKVYRIVEVEQAAAGDSTSWNITIDQPYPEASAKNLKHGVGAVFVGAPWEVVIPTQLVYLRNPNDTLPVYPLT